MPWKDLSNPEPPATGRRHWDHETTQPVHWAWPGPNHWTEHPRVAADGTVILDDEELES